MASLFVHSRRANQKTNAAVASVKRYAGNRAAVSVGPSNPIPVAAQPSSPRAIAAHMRLLANDTLEGREPGTRGFEVAAEYVRAQFAAAGLDVSYQPVPMRAAKLDDSASTLSIDGKALVLR